MPIVARGFSATGPQAAKAVQNKIISDKRFMLLIYKKRIDWEVEIPLESNPFLDPGN